MADIQGLTLRRKMEGVNGIMINTNNLSGNTIHRRLTLVEKICKKILKKETLIIITVLLLIIFLVLFLTYHYKLNVNVHNLHITNESDYVQPIGNATNEDYYITRPNGRNDGGTVRVMFVIASNRIDETLCYAAASAYFTNIPIVVAGYQRQNYNNTLKPLFYLSAARQAGLEDSDVVIGFDADIMFTGLNFVPFIDKFIKLSPASLTELDAKAIRTGEAMAPSLYGAESVCSSYQSISHYNYSCYKNYSYSCKEHEKYENTLSDDVKPFFNYEDNVIAQLNSGTSIHRVWSMRKVFAAYHTFMAVNTPLDIKEWRSDQSVLTKLYMELRQWEIEQDYFRKGTKQLQVMSNEYGLHAGMLGFELKNELSVIIFPDVKDVDFKLTTELWEKDNIETLPVKNSNKRQIMLFVQKLYNQSDVSKLFMERKLTRSYSNVHSVTIAPPLLSVVPRHINGKDKPAERVYPLIVHFSDVPKQPQLTAALNYMQWSLPIMFNEEDWKRGKQYVMSMPIELWTDTNDILRLRYGDVCTKHPFHNFTHH